MMNFLVWDQKTKARVPDLKRLFLIDKSPSFCQDMILDNEVCCVG